MSEWEDYYEILGVDPEASQEEIRRAYRDKAFIFHPDRMAGAPESARQRAEEELKRANRAYETLGDPKKRKVYHAEWLNQKAKPKETFVPKPKPVVEPGLIRFDKVEPGQIKTASFVIRNISGPYNRIWFSNPDSWVRVVSWTSVDPYQDDELPLRVTIEAEGKDWDTSYSEYIRVKLDEEETQVRIELQTKPKPVKEKVWTGGLPKTKPVSPPYTPPPKKTLDRRALAWILGPLSWMIFIPGFFTTMGGMASFSEPTFRSVLFIIFCCVLVLASSLSFFFSIFSKYGCISFVVAIILILLTPVLRTALETSLIVPSSPNLTRTITGIFLTLLSMVLYGHGHERSNDW